jgi:vacuolar-type H+-ATPase subunit B/Vma2
MNVLNIIGGRNGSITQLPILTMPNDGDTYLVASYMAII